jgi:hypothetical protein
MMIKMLPEWVLLVKKWLEENGDSYERDSV